MQTQHLRSSGCCPFYLLSAASCFRGLFPWALIFATLAWWKIFESRLLYESYSSSPRAGHATSDWRDTTGQRTWFGQTFWTGGRTSSLWGWWSPGPGCPGRLWSLLLWRYSRPAWTRSCAACSGWPCFGRRVGLGDPEVPANPDQSVILWNSPVCL